MAWRDDPRRTGKPLKHSSRTTPSSQSCGNERPQVQNCLAFAIKECELGEPPHHQKKVALLPDQFTAFGSADGEPEV